MKKIQREKIQREGSTPCFKRWNRKGYSAFASLKLEVKIGVLCVGMSLISLVANSAYAASANSTDSIEVLRVIELRDVGVTHTKANPTRSTMMQTPIFSRAAAGDAPLQTLESALRLSPAVDVRERGGKGVQADLSIRGGSFDQTQVMLNGINFTDARTGHQTHSLPIDIDLASGIELIDGVSGVGAYAGAINIRTAPIAERYIRLDAGGGAYGYGYGNLSGGYTKGKFNIFGAGSYRRSDGYEYNTGFANWNGYVRSTYDSEKLGFFDFQAGYQKREFGANGFYSLTNKEQYETTETALGSLRWLKSFGTEERFTLNSSVSYRKNFDNYEWIRYSTIGENFHDTDNVSAELYMEYRWKKAGSTTIGADYIYNHIWSTNMGVRVDEGDENVTNRATYTHRDDRHIGNYYLRHTKNWNKFTIAGSAGVSTTPYGTSPMWSISGAYRPARGVTLEAGATQSMRLPTFTDLYYNNATRIADPNLLPESAKTYRVAADYRNGAWSTSAQLYLRDGKNIIDWAQTEEEREEDPSVFYSRQITNLTTYGAEWSGTFAPRNISFMERITASYGFITQDKDSGESISLYAQSYMQHKAALSITLTPVKDVTWVITASLFDRYGNYMDSTGETKDYKPYFLLDSRISWQRGIVKLYIDATNITSTKYYDYGGLAMPPIWFSGGITVTIK
ncbi:MAG: TonB-dependent receptor [Rikenellaceae bacterium]